MEKTSIFTLKSQEHILSDNIYSSGSTGNDISALRDGPSGPISIGITSLADYDKFYITNDNPSFKNAFVPSIDPIDDVITSNFVEGATALPIDLSQKLTVTSAKLNCFGKTTRDLTITNASLTFSPIPDPNLTYTVGLTATVQTNLMINTANLNLQYKLFFKNLPVVIGMDYCVFFYSYWAPLIRLPQNINVCTTIIDPGNQSALLSSMPYTLSDLMFKRERQVPKDGPIYPNQIYYLGQEKIQGRTVNRGLICLVDAFKDLNRAILERSYYDSDSFSKVKQQLNDSFLFALNLPYSYYFKSNSRISSSGLSDFAFCGQNILFSWADVANIAKQGIDEKSFQDDGLKEVGFSFSEGVTPSITRFYLTSAYDYYNRNFKVSSVKTYKPRYDGDFFNNKNQVLNAPNYQFDRAKNAEKILTPTDIFGLENITAVNYTSGPDNNIEPENSDIDYESSEIKLIFNPLLHENLFDSELRFDLKNAIDVTSYSNRRNAIIFVFGLFTEDEYMLNTVARRVMTDSNPLGLRYSGFFGLNSRKMLDYRSVLSKYMTAIGVSKLEMGTSSSTKFPMYLFYTFDVSKALRSNIDENYKTIINPQNTTKLSRSDGINFSDQYAINSMEWRDMKQKNISFNVYAKLSNNINANFIELIDMDKLPLFSETFDEAFRNLGIGSVSIAWSFFDIDFNYAKIKNKVLFDLGSPIGFNGSSGIDNFTYINLKQYFINRGYIKNPYPAGLNTGNGIQINFNYNGFKGSTAGTTSGPFISNFIITSEFNKIIETSSENDYPGKFFDLQSVAIGEQYVNRWGSIMKGRFVPDDNTIQELLIRKKNKNGDFVTNIINLNSYLNGYSTIFGTTGQIGISGTYDWTGTSGSVNGYENVVKIANLDTYNTFYSGYIFPLYFNKLHFRTNNLFATETPVTQSLSLTDKIDPYSQNLYIPTFTYTNGSTGIPSLNFIVDPETGFNASTAYMTISWYYGTSGTIKTQEVNFRSLNGSFVIHEFPELKITDVDNLLTNFSIDVDPSYITSNLYYYDIQNDYRKFGYTSEYGITSSKLDLLGLTTTDLYQVELDLYRFTLVITYYYGDSLFNTHSVFTLGENQERFNLSSSLIQTLRYLEKQRRKFVLSSEIQEPLYIVNIRSNRSGYTFTQDLINVRTYNSSIMDKYKIVKYGYSSIITGSNIPNQIDINNSNLLERNNLNFEIIPGKTNNFNDCNLDKFFDKYITTYNGEDYMSAIHLKTGVTGFLNDFFVFNNVEFTGSTSGYTGTAYVFVTSSTGSDPPLDSGITGLKVQNGFRVGETIPSEQFIEGIDDYTYGFTNQNIKFKYEKYIPNNEDSLKYNNQDLNFNGSSYTNDLTPSQTFKMRILRNTKDDKYDFTKNITFSGNGTGLSGTSFFSGLIPNTKYTTSFLTYNEGPTANTSLIKNFEFTTGSTGIVFGSNTFDDNLSENNERKLDFTINNCFYTKKPGRIVTYLPDETSAYQLLLDSNNSFVQVEKNIPAIFFEDILFREQLYKKSGQTYVSYGIYCTSNDYKLLNCRRYYEQIINLPFDLTFYLDNNSTHRLSTSIPYINGSDDEFLYVYRNGVYSKAPLLYFNFDDGNIGLSLNTPYRFTSSIVNNTGQKQITDILGDGLNMYYSFYNLKRGETYYPKLYMQLKVDNNYLSNCLFTDPFTIPKLPPITIEYYSDIYSYKKQGIIKNFNLFYEGIYNDQQFLNLYDDTYKDNYYDFILRIISINTGKIHFQTIISRYESSPKFLKDINFEIINLDPSSSYSDNEFQVFGAHYIPNSSGNKLTDKFEGTTGITDPLLGGKLITFGDNFSTPTRLNNQFVISTSGFGTTGPQYQDELMDISYKIIPYTIDTLITFDYFKYSKYDQTNSYTYYYGGKLRTYLSDLNDNPIFYVDTLLNNSSSQTLNIKLNKKLLDFDTTYNLKFEYLYTDYDGVGHTGTSFLTDSFKTPEREKFSVGDIYIQPLINKLVINVGNEKNVYADQTFKELNRKNAFSLLSENLVDIPNNSHFDPNSYINNQLYHYRMYVTFNNPVSGITGLYRKTWKDYKSANTFVYEHSGSSFIYPSNTGGSPLNGFNWLEIPNFSETGPTGIPYNYLYKNSNNVLTKFLNPYDNYNKYLDDLFYDFRLRLLNRVEIFDNSITKIVIDKLIPENRYRVNYGILIDETNFDSDFTPMLAVSAFHSLLSNEIVVDSVTGPFQNGEINYYILNDFRYKGSTAYLVDGNVIINTGDPIPVGSTGTIIDSSLFLKDSTLTYQPQLSIDLEVPDFTKPCYFNYSGGFTGIYNSELILNSIAYFNLQNLSYSVDDYVTNIINTNNSLIVIGNTGAYMKTIPLDNLNGDFSFNDIVIDKLQENTTYSDFKIYYNLGSIRNSDEFITIPPFTTPTAIILDYNIEIGITSIYLTINSLTVNGHLLPQGKFFNIDGPLQQIKFYFFVSQNAGDSGKTNRVQTDYFDVNLNNNTGYQLIKLDGADPLYTYDRMYIYYKYLDEKLNYQYIEKVINI
jgi:hypothetical protein